MLMWFIQLLLVILIMRFIEEIGIKGSCILFVILQVLSIIFGSFTLWGLVIAIISGIIYGFFAYIIAKIFLFIIDILGTMGTVIVGAIFILAILAIIF